MSKAEEYYYGLLDKRGKQAYHLMKEGMKAMNSSIFIPAVPVEELGELFFLMRLDHPEIFYVETFKYRFYPGNDDGKIEIIPDYTYTKKQVKSHQQALSSRIQKLTRPAMDLNEKDKEIYVHDFIVKNVHYDKLKKPYSHEIIGPLTNGVGVCEGIAKSVKILLDELGIWNIIAVSDNNPEKHIKYRHTWNIIKLGGQYYHLDVTFDVSLSKDDMIRYDYVNLDDTNVFRDHEPVMYKIPKCDDHKRRYYVEKKMSFTTQEEVRKRCAQAVKKNRVFLFHWRGGYLTREILSELMMIFSEEAEKKGKHAMLSLNWPQAVMKVSFKEGEALHTYELEKANEGEEEDASK